MAADPLAHIKSSSIPKRILITLGLLAAYRLGAAIPVPGASEGLHLFSGGLLPYIVAAVLMSLARPFVGGLDEHFSKGRPGREALYYLTRWAALLPALLYGFYLASPVAADTRDAGIAAATLAAGSLLAVWLAEEITDSGIGNGIVLLLLVDIVGGFGDAFSSLFALVRKEEIGFMVAMIPVLGVALIWGVVVLIETGQRKITVQYSARVVGRQMMAGQKTTMPIKVNSAGIAGAVAVTPIFAFFPLANPLTIPVAAVLIGFFTFYYNASSTETDDVANSVQSTGGYLPGIRPGEATAAYFASIRDRVGLGGAFAFSVLTALWETARLSVGMPGTVAAPLLIIAGGAAFDILNHAQGRAMLEQNDGSLLKAAEKARQQSQPKRRSTKRRKKKRR
jgi:preprotein translocase subunit SecY